MAETPALYRVQVPSKRGVTEWVPISKPVKKSRIEQGISGRPKIDSSEDEDEDSDDEETDPPPPSPAYLAFLAKEKAKTLAAEEVPKITINGDADRIKAAEEPSFRARTHSIVPTKRRHTCPPKTDLSEQQQFVKPFRPSCPRISAPLEGQRLLQRKEATVTKKTAQNTIEATEFMRPFDKSLTPQGYCALNQTVNNNYRVTPNFPLVLQDEYPFRSASQQTIHTIQEKPSSPEPGSWLKGLYDDPFANIGMPFNYDVFDKRWTSDSCTATENYSISTGGSLAGTSFDSNESTSGREFNSAPISNQSETLSPLDPNDWIFQVHSEDELIKDFFV